MIVSTADSKLLWSTIEKRAIEKLNKDRDWELVSIEIIDKEIAKVILRHKVWPKSHGDVHGYVVYDVLDESGLGVEQKILQQLSCSIAKHFGKGDRLCSGVRHDFKEGDVVRLLTVCPGEANVRSGDIGMAVGTSTNDPDIIHIKLLAPNQKVIEWAKHYSEIEPVDCIFKQDLRTGMSVELRNGALLHVFKPLSDSAAFDSLLTLDPDQKRMNIPLTEYEDTMKYGGDIPELDIVGVAFPEKTEDVPCIELHKSIWRSDE